MNAQGADDRPDGAATVLEARGVSKSFVAAKTNFWSSSSLSISTSSGSRST